jgi:hypothetical protein
VGSILYILSGHTSTTRVSKIHQNIIIVLSDDFSGVLEAKFCLHFIFSL